MRQRLSSSPSTADLAGLLGEGLSSIVPEDSFLFRQVLDHEQVETYGNAWYYVTQSGNGNGDWGLGFKYQADGALLTIGAFPRFNGTWHFHIVRPLGVRGAEVAFDVAEKLFAASGNAVFLKKLTHGQAEQLRSRGCKTTASSLGWHPEAAVEDDQFPEIIVPIEEALEQFHGRRSVGDKWKRASRKWARGFILRDYVPSLREDALVVLRAFFSVLRSQGRMISDVRDYVNMLMAPPYGVPREDYWGGVGYVESEPAALFFCERLATGPWGVYATAVYREKYRYLSYLLHEQIFSWLNDRGVKEVNLGGSEYKGLDDFKRRFAPKCRDPREHPAHCTCARGVREVHMEWCVYQL